MILAKMFTSDKQRWEQLRESLDSFGKASGLFNDLEVRRIGREESDPFQIKIKVSGPAFNLVDVGYGISQVLPIVVEAVRGRKGGTFLLQQPEVHLHPKAQAELGSFLATLAKHDNKRFVIETHSDYLVDRIRMDVRDGKHLSPDDVALLYFERKNGNVEIKRLELDRFGNITNAPAGYRQFFLEEEMRLLGA
jgi:predicted ATPase